MPFISDTEVAISCDPSSMAGIRCECISATSQLRSTSGRGFFFFPKKIIFLFYEVIRNKVLTCHQQASGSCSGSSRVRGCCYPSDLSNRRSEPVAISCCRISLHPGHQPAAPFLLPQQYLKCLPPS